MLVSFLASFSARTSLASVCLAISFFFILLVCFIPRTPPPTATIIKLTILLIGVLNIALRVRVIIRRVVLYRVRRVVGWIAHISLGAEVRVGEV